MNTAKDQSPAIFRRQNLVFKKDTALATLPLEAKKAERENKKVTLSIAKEESEFKVLVINASQNMAKEITMQLNLNFPGCSITYAPSIEMARLILSRRKFSLVVSNQILPDGNVSKLQDVLTKAEPPPDLLVVCSEAAPNPEVLGLSGYRFAACQQLAGSPALPRINRPGWNKTKAEANLPDLGQTIKTLGADLRNDLNNPLQEIVAMVYVAKAGGSGTPVTQEALDAITKAAQNMAKVVRGLEEKIKEAVQA